MVFVRETGASGTFVTAELALVVSRHDHQKLYECRSANWADDHIVEMITFCPDNHDGNKVKMMMCSIQSWERGN